MSIERVGGVRTMTRRAHGTVEKRGEIRKQQVIVHVFSQRYVTRWARPAGASGRIKTGTELT